MGGRGVFVQLENYLDLLKQNQFLQGLQRTECQRVGK